MMHFNSLMLVLLVPGPHFKQPGCNHGPETKYVKKKKSLPVRCILFVYRVLIWQVVESRPDMKNYL